jgi:hypothetical protein
VIIRARMTRSEYAGILAFLTRPHITSYKATAEYSTPPVRRRVASTRAPTSLRSNALFTCGPNLNQGSYLLMERDAINSHIVKCTIHKDQGPAPPVPTFELSDTEQVIWTEYLRDALVLSSRTQG